MKYSFNLDTYTTFLIGNGNRYSGVEASKALNLSACAPAHDSISRWLAEQTFKPQDLWKHVQSQVHLKSSLIIDDTVLDKRWSPHNELTDFHWSGNAHKVTRGISLVNLLATHESDCIPVDYRVYEGTKGKTNKNEHALAMLSSAKKRGFKPNFVMADCWYSSLLTMKAIVKLGWKFIFGMKENRLVNETQGQYIAVSSLDWTQITHIFSCFVAFVKLEFERLKTGVSWYEQKAQRVRVGLSHAFA